MKIYSVVNGSIKALEKVNDPAFSQKMLGDGIAIVPSDGIIMAPCDAEVMMVFPTNHALGLKSDEGVEILIHIGIDTVELQGVGFKSFVKQGDRVRKGDPLVNFDVNKVEQAGYESDVMVVISNSDAYHFIKNCAKIKVTTNDVIVEIG